MSILAWIFLGLVSGFLASKIVNKQGEGFVLDVVLGVVGAIIGGFLFTKMGAAGVSGFNLYSMFVAVIGSIIVLVAYHALFAAPHRGLIRRNLETGDSAEAGRCRGRRVR